MISSFGAQIQSKVMEICIDIVLVGGTEGVNSLYNEDGEGWGVNCEYMKDREGMGGVKCVFRKDEDKVRWAYDGYDQGGGKEKIGIISSSTGRLGGSLKKLE